MRVALGMVLLLMGYTLFYVGQANLRNGGKGPTFFSAIAGDDGGANVGAGAGAIGGSAINANQTGNVPQTTPPTPPVILA